MKNEIISIKSPSLKKIEQQLGNMKHKAPAIFARSLNRTLPTLQSILIKEAQKTFTVKSTAFKKSLKISKAYKNRLSISVKSNTRRPIPLIGFAARPIKPSPNSPVIPRVRVQHGKSYKSFSGKSGSRSPAFVAKMPTGHVGIFQRDLSKTLSKTDTPRRVTRKDSLWGRMPDNPIKQLFGPPLPFMFSAEVVREKGLTEGSDRLKKILDHEIKRALAR